LALTLLSKDRDGRFDVADEPKIHGGPAADVFGIFVDLDFLHATAGEELREGEVRAEQEQEFGVMNGAIGSAVTEQAGQANGIGIVMFEPLLAAERIADRRL
jgi:hypothetical protein